MSKPIGRGIWRYLDFLPVYDASRIVSLGEGDTFLHRCSRLAEAFNMKEIYIKDETTNATGSFMDRGTSVAVTHSVEVNAHSVCGAATGNFGASLAAYAAKAGLDCTIFIPRYIDLGKLYQMIAYGAEVELAENYEDAAKKAYGLSDHTHLTSTFDPFFLEGEKTTGYEICEQLGWKTPDRIVVPMGDGSHISMIWKGLKEFASVGLLSSINVKMTGVQLEGYAPIATVLSAKGNAPLTEPERAFAGDIAIAKPALASSAVQAVKESCGEAVTVSDKEIFEAMELLAKTEGIFAEPAAASTVAGVKKLRDSGRISRDESTVCVITGSGLKDPVTARKMVRKNRLGNMVRRVEDRSTTPLLGSTKAKILSTCSEQESYGYNIWKTLEEHFSLSVKIPTVYQHLAELEAMGLVERIGAQQVMGKPARYYYRLTQRGEKVLETLGPSS